MSDRGTTTVKTASTAPRQATLVLLLSLALVFVGFVAGAGYQTARHAGEAHSPSSASPTPEPAQPEAKGLRVSPDHKMLALTEVYDDARHSRRIVLNLETLQFSSAQAPRGWQDFVDQWSNDGKAILFEREKIPRSVEEATPGLYKEDVAPPAGAAPEGGHDLGSRPPQLLTKQVAPPGDKVLTGFWAPDGRLTIKTRREPQFLYLVNGRKAQLVDQGSPNFYQTRAVNQNGRLTFFVVRSMPGQHKVAALYRIDGGRATRVGQPLGDLVWAYVAEKGQWLIVCRHAPKSDSGWLWSLYRISQSSLNLVQEKPISSDVLAVYWSPDQQHVFGGGGKSLWLVDIPSLQLRQLGPRADWDFDDATWLDSATALVAAGGFIWKVDTRTGGSQQLWRLPAH